MKTFGTMTALLLAVSLVLTACTVTPAVPSDEVAAPTEVADTAAGTGENGDVDSSQAVTSTAGTAVTETAAGGDATAAMTTTTTIITTTVTTLTEGAALSETQVTTDATGTGTSGTTEALPTATQAANITVTAPVSTPIAAAAQAAAVTTATSVVTDANAGSILQVVSTTPGLETLAAALTASGMATALEQPGPLTFFAPNNDAFAALPQDQLDALLADPTALAPILQYHIVIDNVAASRLGTLGAALSSSGQPITVTVQGDGSLLVNDARIVQPDIPAANGAIHVIDKVLLPPPTTP
jgi:uncharacterized surface protein with fasciclin (FAS1) repeats